MQKQQTRQDFSIVHMLKGLRVIKHSFDKWVLRMCILFKLEWSSSHLLLICFSPYSLYFFPCGSFMLNCQTYQVASKGPKKKTIRYSMEKYLDIPSLSVWFFYLNSSFCLKQTSKPQLKGSIDKLFTTKNADSTPS